MIRFATAEDTTKVIALWNRCFGDDPAFSEWFFANQYRPEQTLLLYESDVLCAMLQMLPYQYQDGTSISEVTYIYGACTAPEYRRQGYMAMLLRESFRIDQKMGRAASILIPAEPWLYDFYQQYGYETAFYVSNDTIGCTGSARPEGTVRPLTKKDWNTMQSLYTASLPMPHLMRSRQNWEDQIQMFQALGGTVLGWFSRCGELVGYAFVWNVADGLWAQELLCTDPEQMANAVLWYLGKSEIKITVPGAQSRLGCLRSHTEQPIQPGYFNLLFN